jgi:hypothetical protein
MEKRIYKINDDDGGQLIWIFGGKKKESKKLVFLFSLLKEWINFNN